MTASNSPCSGHLRRSKTRPGIPPVRQTSAGASRWQMGHREVVLFSSSSRRTGGGANEVRSFRRLVNLLEVEFVSTGKAAEAIHRDARETNNNRHTKAECEPAAGGSSEAESEENPASDTGDAPTQDSKSRSEV